MVPVEEIFVIVFVISILYSLVQLYNNATTQNNIQLNSKVKELERSKKLQEENMKDLLDILNDVIDISDTIVTENNILVGERTKEFKTILKDFQKRKCNICSCKIGIKINGCRHIVHKSKLIK